jgi:quinol monooxygenase YgiN
MIVVRFEVQCRPGKTEEVRAALAEVVAPSRELEGVISFDIARDLADPDTFIATEVFEDRAALDRQESLPEVGRVMELLPDSVAAPPEATIYHVSSSEPHGG